MAGMNLLPPWLIHKQRMRWLVIWLTLVQCIILISLITGYGLLSLSIAQTQYKTEALQRLLEDKRYTASDDIAERLKYAAARIDAQNAFLLSANLSSFDSAWLSVINDMVPYDDIVEIHIDGARIIITCVAESWESASVYREALHDTGLFTLIRFGAFISTEDGRVRYDLNLWAE